MQIKFKKTLFNPEIKQAIAFEGNIYDVVYEQDDIYFFTSEMLEIAGISKEEKEYFDIVKE